jgi:polysaccharide biosynthesis protein PslH
LRKPNLAILLSRFPYPHFKGDSLRAYYQIVDLCQVFNIHLHCLVNAEPNTEAMEALKPYTATIHCYELETIDGLLEIGLHFFNGLPNQVNMFTDEDIFWEMQDNLKAQNIDLLYCQLARMAKYALTIDKPKVLDFQDAFSINYKRSIENSKWYWKIFYSIEAKRMQKFENILASKMNACIIISEADKLAINNNENIHVVNNGVDRNKYQNTFSAKKYDVCFAGNLSYAPNIQAVKYLAEQLVPLLLSKKKDLQIAVAGATPTPEVVAYCKKANIILLQDVVSMVEVYNSSKIFVAPLFAGAGMQNKILEAMACEVPCVTTDVVNNAIGAVPNEQILIANTADDFCAAIFNLLADSNLQSTIISGAKQLLDSQYNWQQSNKKLIDVLKGVIA